MKAFKPLTLLLIVAISGVLSQDLVQTSDTTIEVFSKDTTDLEFKAIDSAAVPLYAVEQDPSK